MKQQKKQSGGYTMIESIAFLGIVIMLGVSVMTLISRMHDKFKLSRVGQQVVELQKAIDYRYVSAPNYKDLSVENLINEKLAPNDMVSDGNLYHAYAGAVSVNHSVDYYSYRITFSQLPAAACVELAMQEWNTKHTAHLLTLKINDTKFAWNGTANRQLPISLDQAENLCTRANDSNTIVWQFQ